MPGNQKKKNVGRFHLCPKRKGLPRPALLTWGFQALLELGVTRRILQIHMYTRQYLQTASDSHIYVSLLFKYL